MPPLPEETPIDGWAMGYTDEQMLTYAEAYRKAWVASLKPAAWQQTSTDVTLVRPMPETAHLWTELYRLDDQP
jgi:hypothetical protein